jgi:hypothetical protein
LNPFCFHSASLVVESEYILARGGLRTTESYVDAGATYENPSRSADENASSSDTNFDADNVYNSMHESHRDHEHVMSGETSPDHVGINAALNENRPRQTSPIDTQQETGQFPKENAVDSAAILRFH